VRILTKLSLLTVLTIGLSGCSTFEDEDDPKVIPELAEIQLQFTPKIKWQEQIGDGVDHHFSRLVPKLHEGVVYAASREGIVTALDFNSGKDIWSVDLRDEAEGFFADKRSQKIAGGLTIAYSKLYLGTEHGDVLAMNIATGEVLWRQSVKGEVISPPGAGEGLIFVNTGAGFLVALHPDSGEQRWEYEQEVPPLTLRGISAPVVENGGVIFGSANGKLNVVIAESGLEAWQQSVATAVGASELERLVDVDTQPVLSGSTIYSLAYNGNLIAVDMQNGKIQWKKEYSAYQNMSKDGFMLYLTDVSGHVYAVDSRDGSMLWQQNTLDRRGVTGAYASGDYVVVGDSFGYLHWLSKDTGALVSRLELDDTGFYVRAVGKDNEIIVLTRDGELTVVQTP
jgi:outer membrane protein assembly factor BamB